MEVFHCTFICGRDSNGSDSQTTVVRLLFVTTQVYLIKQIALTCMLLVSAGT
jgi:hypothetical protein